MTNTAPSLTRPDGTPLRVLVVDDEVNIAELVSMAVRYEGADGFADLEVNDRTGNGSAPYMGRLSVLKEWNEQDPPSAFEQRRNDRIHDGWQGNRNPFVDHPEWVESIF